MHNRFDSRRVIAVGGALAMLLFGACSDTMPTTPSATPGVDMASSTAFLTSADFVIPGADLGAFVNSIVADNAGYATSAFWNNSSDDGVNCSVGHYALGSMEAGCILAAPGSTANQGGGYTKYWGDGAAHRQASSFMFSGNYAYLVTLKGSYAGGTSEIGWFTVSGGVYAFHPVPAFGSKTINSSVIIHPASGANFGFYIKTVGHPVGLSCATDTDCSDATGDIHAIPHVLPVQQFALMTNVDGSNYLVGVEDNAEEVADVGDDDFNDYLLSVEPFPMPQFVIGDVEAHGVGTAVNFWGAQWWKNNTMSGIVSNGVASFKGYATDTDNFCGGTWTSRPGNSSNPPDALAQDVAIIVTSKVLKSGATISGDIKQILIVHQDGGYGPNPGHAGNGPVTRIACPTP